LRILHISKKTPYPQRDGESIANSNLAQSLHDSGIRIDLASLNTNKHYVDHNIAKENLAFYSNISIIDHELRLSAVAALKHLLTDRSYNIERFKSVDFSRKLEDILTEHRYDCILLETIYVLPYLEIIRQLSAAVVILRTHNVEHQIWENKSTGETNFAKAYYLEQLAKQLNTYQRKYIPLCDGVISVSSIDYEWYKTIIPESNLLLSPIGIDFQKYQSYQKQDSSVICGFIGSMDWQPNTDGIQWYLKNVWPELKLKHPSLSFHLAGRNMPSYFNFSEKDKIINHGEVENGLAFMSSIDVLIVPLFITSGIRVKIIEAMAMGKVVLTTSKGLQGISAVHGKEVLIADSSSEFIHYQSLLINDAALKESISVHASKFAEKNFAQQTLSEDIIEFINSKIEEKLRFS